VPIRLSSDGRDFAGAGRLAVRGAAAERDFDVAFGFAPD
jgi:hypothetical protein